MLIYLSHKTIEDVLCAPQILFCIFIKEIEITWISWHFIRIKLPTNINASVQIFCPTLPKTWEIKKYDSLVRLNDSVRYILVFPTGFFMQYFFLT